jgi:hypothetical protein
MERYGHLLAVLLTGYVLEPLLARVYMRNLIALGEKCLAAVRQELFRTLLMQRLAFYDKHPAAELQSAVGAELDSVRGFIFNNCSRDRGLRAFAEATGSILVLFVLSWRLAPVCTAVIVAAALAAAAYRARTRAVEQALGSALSRMSGVALQAFDGIRTVRSFGGEALERERFQAQVAASYDAGLALGAAKADLEATNRLAIHAALLALYGWGGWLVAGGHLPVGALVTGIGFTFSLTYAIQGSIATLAELRRASGAIERVQDLVQGGGDPDPSMYAALPPGAWWDVANGDVDAAAADAAACALPVPVGGAGSAVGAGAGAGASPRRPTPPPGKAAAAFSAAERAEAAAAASAAAAEAAASAAASRAGSPGASLDGGDDSSSSSPAVVEAAAAALAAARGVAAGPPTPHRPQTLVLLHPPGLLQPHPGRRRRLRGRAQGGRPRAAQRRLCLPDPQRRVGAPGREPGAPPGHRHRPRRSLRGRQIHRRRLAVEVLRAAGRAGAAGRGPGPVLLARGVDARRLARLAGAGAFCGHHRREHRVRQAPGARHL